MSMVDTFNLNLKNYITNELIKQSMNYSEDLDLRGNFMLLINRIRRTPIAQKRNVIESSVFSCPQDHMPAYQRFIHLVESGCSLLRFCSRVNFEKPYEANDPLFDDWGIVHFHFFEAGTKEVMFAIVEPETIFLLAVFPHGKGYGDVWYKKQLLEIVNNEFPSLIAHLKLGNSKKVTTTEEHRQARKLRVNIPVVLNDGSSYYPPGNGIMSNKESVHDNMAWMHLSKQIEAYSQYTSKHVEGAAYDSGVGTSKLSFSLGFAYDQQQQLFFVQCKSSSGVVISL
jgi:hypothetical protein